MTNGSPVGGNNSTLDLSVGDNGTRATRSPSRSTASDGNASSASSDRLGARQELTAGRGHGRDHALERDCSEDEPHRHRHAVRLHRRRRGHAHLPLQLDRRTAAGRRQPLDPRPLGGRQRRQGRHDRRLGHGLRWHRLERGRDRLGHRHEPPPVAGTVAITPSSAIARRRTTPSPPRRPASPTPTGTRSPTPTARSTTAARSAATTRRSTCSVAGNGDKGDTDHRSRSRPPMAPPPSGAATDSVLRQDTTAGRGHGCDHALERDRSEDERHRHRHAGRLHRRRRGHAHLHLQLDERTAARSAATTRRSTSRWPATATRARRSPSRSRPPTAPPTSRRDRHASTSGQLRPGHGHRRDHALSAIARRRTRPSRHAGRVHRRRRGPAHLHLPVVQERHADWPAPPRRRWTCRSPATATAAT